MEKNFAAAVTDSLRAAVEAQRRAEVNQRIERFEKVLSATFSNAATYTTVVVFGGYAAFFGLWQLTKDLLEPNQARWAAILFIISVATFAFFEVFKMIWLSVVLLYRTIRLSGAKQRGDTAGAEKMLEALEAGSKPSLVVIAVTWAMAVMVSVPTAMAGCGILLYSFARGLVH